MSAQPTERGATIGPSAASGGPAILAALGLCLRPHWAIGLAILALALLTGPAASRSEGDSAPPPRTETGDILARSACQDAVRNAYWQAVNACLALEAPEDRGQCGAAARSIRQHDMALCRRLFEGAGNPPPTP